MSLRRNQLKKMTLDQIMERLGEETDSDNIKLITSFIADKNQVLLEKRTELTDRLLTVRNKIQKNVHGMNGRVKDRIEKKETLLLNKDSRPNTQTMTELMELYTYLQNQGKIVVRNNTDIENLASQTEKRNVSLKEGLDVIQSYEELDSRYSVLHEKCEQQTVIRDALLAERDRNRAHYANISNQIENCRKEYEVVEEDIRVQERQLIQLNTYLNSRRQEDHQALIDLPQQAISFETELLQAQNRLNQCQDMLQNRKFMDVESSLAVEPL